MGKLLKTVLVIVMLPVEMVCAMVREIVSAVSMVINVWKGDTFVETVLKDLTYRGEQIEEKKDQARDLAKRLRL